MKNLILLCLVLVLLSCSSPQTVPQTLVDEARRACSVYAAEHELQDACLTLDQLAPFITAMLKAQEQSQELPGAGEPDETPEASTDAGAD